MHRHESPIEPDAPLMNGAAFCDIAGISDVQLRYYRENGVLTSADAVEPSQPLRYTMDQVAIGHLVDALRHNDMSVPDIAAAIASGEEALIDSTRLQCAQEMRSMRRRLKAVTNLERSHRDFRAADGKRGLYVRYFPARWLALIPVAGGTVDIPAADQLVEAQRLLRAIVSTVGWSEALAYGVLLSVSADMASASRYAFVELASPPMPAITGARVIDGGCYSDVAAPDQRLSCHGKRCTLCARFGRHPQPGERQAWRTLDRREPWRRNGTVMIGDLDSPYPDGTWHRFTEEALQEALHGEGESAEQGRARSAGAAREDHPFGDGGPRGEARRPASVPRKMPHVTPLPLGVTACELPAAHYLCRRFAAEPDESFAHSTDQTLSALKATLGQLDMTRIAPNATCPAFAKDAGRVPADAGPYVEPFAMPRAVSDPAFAGSCATVSRKDLEGIRLPYGAALWPETGFCILEAVQPLATRPAPLVREFQVQVTVEGPLLEKLQSSSQKHA